MDRELTYEKRSAEKEIVERNEVYMYEPPRAEVHITDTSGIPSAYKKEDGMLSYSLICVISGGTNRERTFLNELERKHTFPGVDVIFVSTEEGDGGLTPRMMLSEYERMCRDGSIDVSGRSFKLESVDKIYMFSDVDHYENELKEILRNQRNEIPIWIISNPDFEIWIYYCYRNEPNMDLQDVVEEVESKRSSALKRINGRFNSGGGLDTRKAFEHLEDGISHSKEHYAETDGFPHLLCTQMHVFAEDILMRLGNEYKDFLRKKQKFREKMRSRSE